MFVLVSYFAKNNVLVLKLFWSNLMAVLGLQLWPSLPKDVDHLCILEPCSVSAARHLGILLLIVLKNFCSYCKKKGHIIKECRIRPQNRPAQAFQTSVLATPSAALVSPSDASSVPAPPALDYCTPAMVQQILISALSAMGFQGNHSHQL